MRKLLMLICFPVLLGSCGKYLDIVPDNVATIESAFTLRATAERYLFTCYSWMPKTMNMTSDPAAGYWGGEIWGKEGATDNNAYFYGKGTNGVSSPLLNYWSGSNGGLPMFRAIRECNIFLDNVGNVPDLTTFERDRWIAEVKFLKAYYHFHLMRMYGPIPLIKESLPISASPEQVQTPRAAMDECFDYVIQLLDESYENLPEVVIDPQSEMGRVTAIANRALKAKILMTAASPLYNGNPDYVDFVNSDGSPMMNNTYDPEKWVIARDAVKAAIDLAHQNNVSLYVFSAAQTPGLGAVTLSDTTEYKLSIANALAFRWNSETIWADPTNAPAQGIMTPTTWNPDIQPGSFNHISGSYGASMEFSERFYTANGLPIDEDKTFDYENRYDIVQTRPEDAFNLMSDYDVVKMHLDRENRFYANLAFDGTKWYGQGKYSEDDNWTVDFKRGGNMTMLSFANSITGYQVKKRIHFQNVITGSSSYSVVWYPAMLIRLSDLYLLYAEAINEVSGPTDEAYEYVNQIRERAGIPTVQDAWTNYAIDATKYQSKDGFREIIHRERELELCFESQLFWDSKRWKEAEERFTGSISGWTFSGDSPETYYVRTHVFEQKFEKRNYLDPLAESVLLNNPKLVQNPGW
ncbi:RagB/SusD family nutrient uptake outer membrane protein [Parapedobacter sp. 10938]|uniref:RagB/SusD family nutrient uptake outer membrane protein n=1 Tax=Parapedobacter flavus TaxID=3110225 RepID=UPI002DB9C6F5|nr:RagB/SusD family nutrient uptake outer membrane protein [Parapedobacter sp. 10938]MEC3878447.1 RagB/SusD family nutrient uptake outer membrane protein [Parapedobacter sp. 10938]